MQGDPSLAYMAVYDGHGGTGVANYLKDHLHEFILAQPEYRCEVVFIYNATWSLGPTPLTTEISHHYRHRVMTSDQRTNKKQ